LSFIAAAELLRATSDGSVDHGRLLTVYFKQIEKNRQERFTHSQ
jgi:hypothetical protein